MTITIPLIAVPIGLSLVFLCFLLRPHIPHSYIDFEVLYRFFWIIPIQLVWILYFLFVIYWK